MTEEEEVEGKWNRNTCPGKTASDMDLVDGNYRSVVVDLPNLGVQIACILIELCSHCMALIWVGDLPQQFYGRKISETH